MKKFFLTAMLLLCAVMGAQAEVDPNFYIYICFGQSNMEGNAQWEAQDVGNVDPRFQMLATCNFDNPKRKLGNWYTAECPIVSPVGKLGPSDYFGRTMVKELPDKKIGVIAVAMGGSPIEMFDKDLYEQKYKDNYNEHQGESNNGDEKWPGMVKKIYKDMLRDLGLRASDVPIFVGETEYEEMGGGCSWHNHVVAKIPEVIPTGHVVSAKDIPGNGTDPWHFSAEGYRIFGKRYAEKVLDVMNHPEAYTKQYTIDERLTGTLTDLAGKSFAIVNEAEQKAFYCESGQQLGYGDFKTAFDVSNEGYQFKVSRISGGSSLKLMTPDDEVYEVDGNTAYLNTQDVTGDCCFVNGLNNQRGYEIANGAVWKLEYEDGKGWAMKNGGTGKYLKDPTSPAKYDEPTYFTFCTLKEATTGIEAVTVVKEINDNNWYSIDGRKVNPENLRPGLYINKGRKIVIKLTGKSW